jgi:signal transduction histidine kinase
MYLSALEQWLLPAEMERNVRFQDDLFRLSRTGLRLLGVMEMTIAVFGHSALSLVVGLVTLAAAQAKGIRRHMRAVAMASGFLTAAALMQTRLWSGELALLMFAVVAAVPLIPLQTCVLGSAIGVLYAVRVLLGGAWDGSLQVFLFLLTCFATGVSALLYAQKRAQFEAHQRALTIQETLTSAQSRALVAESAIALGRLAAALTHEINTPLGALKSAVDTMMRLAERPQDERTALVQADLRRSIDDSADRLSTVVARLKRLIALEWDEKHTSNVNDLLCDARMLLEDRITKGVKLDWRLQDVPPVTCSTNQMTTVFSSLLANAIAAVEGKGSIEVITGANNGTVEVTIRDDGHGMDPEDVATIFDPSFKVQQGRVLGGNWSLFTARQIVNEHGGDIWIESRKGGGTTAYVALPALRT